MTADQLVTYLSWAVFVTIFGRVLIQCVRQPRRANLNITLFFGATAIVILTAVLTGAGLVPPNGIFSYLSVTAVLALPYLLLRLMDDIVVVPLLLRRVVELLLAAGTIALWLLPLARPVAVNLVLLLYVLAVMLYVVMTSIRATLRSRGVTRRRMVAVTAGSLFLVLNLSVGNLTLALPSYAGLWHVLADLLGLASGVSYFLGFAPPRWLRRAWQGPELRAFLGRAASLPRLPDTIAIMRALEQGAGESTGAPYASIGLWDEQAGMIRFTRDDTLFDLPPDSDVPAARAFALQKPIFSPKTRYTGAAYDDLRMSQRATAVLAAPISAGDKRLGVLIVYAPRAPVFADDDLALVQLLADQAAVLLENRALIDEAARIRARTEAARLKEDFLSAAAHDLKTPLTTLIALGQLLERRAQRDPYAPADLTAIQRLVREGQRLRALVLELLDASQVERGKLLDTRDVVDITGLAEQICTRQSNERHQCIVEAHGPVIGVYDGQRIGQLIENLVENAIKYSPGGGKVCVSIHQDGGVVHLSVSDNGIGIPPDDLPHLFDRFHRGANVDDRRFPGMGLGLYICKGIVEQHGGRITVSSRLGEGSTFNVTLPLAPARAAVYAA